MKAKIPMSLDVTHTTLAVIFIGMLIASSFWILLPFLISIVWASIIVIATWPVLLKLETFLAGRRGLAVTIMTVAILLVFLIPLTLAVVAIVGHAEGIAAQVRSVASLTLPSPPDWIERIPFQGEKLAARWRAIAALSPEARAEMISPYAKDILQWFVAQAGSIGMIMLHFLITTIIAAIMYARGEIIRAGLLSFARRLAGPHGESVAVLAAKAVRGVALAVVLTAIIQTAIGCAGLFATGVPGAALLTAVLFIVCLTQIGPIPVLLPAVIWLYWKDGALWGTMLLIFAILAVTVDNIVRPVLIKKGANLPLLLIFSGVIGGLIAFGVIGLFIGPVVLAVTYTLLKAWVTGSMQEDEAGSGAE